MRWLIGKTKLIIAIYMYITFMLNLQYKNCKLCSLHVNSKRVVFDQSDLSGSIFRNAVLSGTTFNGATLKDSDFSQAFLGGFLSSL